VTILARNVTFQEGAKLLAHGSTSDGGTVAVLATGSVAMAASSRIDVTSGLAGSIDIVAQAFTLSGELRATSTTRDGDGGLVTVITTGDIAIGGAGINASGGDRFSSGGLVDLTADGDLRDVPAGGGGPRRTRRRVRRWRRRARRRDRGPPRARDGGGRSPRPARRPHSTARRALAGPLVPRQSLAPRAAPMHAAASPSSPPPAAVASFGDAV
jgi:hypothetical protein